MSRISQHPTERDRYGLNMALAAFSRRENLYPGAADLVKCLLSQIDNDHAAKEPSYDALHAEDEALRAENERLKQQHERLYKLSVFLRIDSTDARILIRDIAPFFTAPNGRNDLHQRIDAFLTSAPVPDHLRDSTKMAEQGERQEAVGWLIDWPDKPGLGFYFSSAPNENARSRPLYTTPQPGPDVRGLASFALELIDGAWKGGSFDGGDIQEAGVRHGLLVMEQRQESCGEHCDCAEYGFPSECYRLTPALAAQRQAQRQA